MPPGGKSHWIRYEIIFLSGAQEFYFYPRTKTEPIFDMILVDLPPDISYPISVGSGALDNLPGILDRIGPSQIGVLVDEHTEEHCLNRLQEHLPAFHTFRIASGEGEKLLATCEKVWQGMTNAAFDRKSLLINLGGGVIGDLGGFVASTYKRGIRFIQIPTTLLAQVDASVGSKLGVDFQGYKNHIGVFNDPEAVLIDPTFLKTLPPRELRSGFAEIIKHHLIADAEGWHQLRATQDLERLDLPALIRHSVAIKSHIVATDPNEQGKRKSLNFGHTFGHALESEWLNRPQPFLHGEAIAAGMVMESYLSHHYGMLAEPDLDDILQLFGRLYPVIPLKEKDEDALLARMSNDKKNEGGDVMCTLLDGLGRYQVNVPIPEQDARKAFAFYRSTYGLD